MKLSYFAALILLGASASPAMAAGSQLMGVVPGGTPCYEDPQRGVAGYQTGNLEFFLENLTDGLLPNPVTITGSTIWVQGGVPSNIFGNLSMAIDPQQVYAKTAGFPAYQYYVVNTFKTLAVMQIQPSNAGLPGQQQYMGNQFVWQTLPQPFDYYPGDAIAFAPECGSTDPTKKTVLPTLVSVTLSNPDIPPLQYVLNFPPVQMVKTSNPGRSLRNLLPAAAAASSKIRVKLLHAFNDNHSSRITNMAVCVQAASGSPDCASTPVPMLCFQTPWTIVYPSQTVWCDWTDFALSPGQVPIVIADVFTPSEDGVMHWSYNPSGGLGDWAGMIPSYNQAVMGGSPVWQPNRTHVIYGAQVQ